ALFTEDQRDSPSELAFKYSIYRINKRQDSTRQHDTCVRHTTRPERRQFPRSQKKGRAPRQLDV
ncbi:hypothetical protein CEXT_375231, partial [Caerostris extrusa]